MVDDLFSNLPPKRKRRLFDDEDTRGMDFREMFTPTREGPLRPRPSGKGGPSINQGAAVVTGHRYWRFNVTTPGTSGFCSISEIQFRTAAGVPLLFSGGTASASSEAFSTVAGAAADNNTTTVWIGTSAPITWMYDYGAGQTRNIVEMTMQARTDSSADQGPQVFTPQWSDDGLAWTSMTQITAAPWTTLGQIQTFAVTPAVVTSSVWSAADASANAMTLSNGGLTVTPSGASAWQTIRNSAGKTSGKLYVEFKCSSGAPAFGFEFFGLANSSFVIASNLGAGNYSVGFQSGGGTVVSSGFTSNYAITLGAAALNDVLSLAVDFGSGNIWIGRNNVWVNSSNPATGSLPTVSFTPVTVGALFAAMSFYTDVSVWTLQATAASQKYAPPAGFSAWDGGVAPPPTSVWSTSDAAANAMTLSNGGLTVTANASSAWQSIRGTTSKTSGKFYIEFKSGAIASGQAGFGAASASFVVTNYLGTSDYSLGMFSGSAGNYGSPSANFTFVGAIPLGAAANDVWALAIDFTAGKAWLSANGAWANSGDPATGTLPWGTFTAPSLGQAYFPGLTIKSGYVWTLQATAASQTYAPPSGFSAWG